MICRLPRYTYNYSLFPKVVRDHIGISIVFLSGYLLVCQFCKHATQPFFNGVDDFLFHAFRIYIWTAYHSFCNKYINLYLKINETIIEIYNTYILSQKVYTLCDRVGLITDEYNNGHKFKKFYPTTAK